MKMKLHFLANYTILIFFLVLLSSCATTININVKRPAKLDLKGAKSIAVLPFEESRYDPFNYFFEMIGDENANFPYHYNEMAYNEQRILTYLHDEIERQLNSSPFIKLENYLPVKNAIRYGGKIPVDVFVTGEMVSFKVRDFGKKIKHKIPEDKNDLINNKKGDIIFPDEPKTDYYYEIVYTRQVQVIFNYQIIDADTKQIIAHDTINIERESSEVKEQKMLPDIFYIVDDDLQEFVNSLLKDLQPYSVNKTITLLKDPNDNKNMEEADKLVKSGYLREGYRAFANIYVQTNLFEAGYNASMVLMALGELKNAESLMYDLYRKTADKRALSGLKDIKYEIEQSARLREQIGQKEDYF